MKSFALLGALALITSSASAAFTGWTVDMTTVGGRNIYKVYANFDATGAGANGSSQRVLNCFDFGKADSTPQNNQIAAGSSGTMNAVHNDNYQGDVDSDGDGAPDVFGSMGTWAADLSAMSAVQSATDSFVTMQGIGNGWGTALDPSFGTPYGPQAGGISPPNSNAGWYDATPGTQNLIGATYRVRLMQIARIAADDTTAYTANLTLGYAYLGSTVAQFGYGSFTIPAPGAIALVGLAGLIGRRRRA